MKKVLIAILSSLIIGLALNVQAASVTFDPGEAVFKVAPSETDSASLTVHGFSSAPYSLLMMIGSKMENSNIPPGWLVPVYLMLNSRDGGESATSMNLAISVPPEATAGFYTGVLVPEAMRSSETITSEGLIVSIEVTEPQASCSGVPMFSNVEISPQDIWAPTDLDVAINISGNLSVDAGCEATAGYAMESNNGMVQGDISIAPDGSFTERVMVNVSRSGQDKDGRVFNGSLYAMNAEGERANLDFAVTVLHDKGKKVGQQ